MKNLKKSVSMATVITAIALSPVTQVKATEIDNTNFLSIDLETENNQYNDNSLVANTAENSLIKVENFNKTRYVIVEELNIRKRPNKKSKKLGTLSFGDKIKVSETESKNWVKILYKNEVAYVYKKYLSNKKKKYSKEELSLMAHLLNAECGSETCSDKMLYYAGSVVLNRVKNNKFPNSLHDVIYAHGQYACTWNGAINKTPSNRCWKIAKKLLTYGSILPQNVVFQAEFKQGSGVYEKVQNEYFCKY